MTNQSKRADSLSSSALRYPIFEDLFRRTDYSNAVPELFVIREQARASALLPLSHPLQELPHCLPEISLPSLWLAFVVSLLWKIALPLARTIAPMNSA